MDRFVRYLKATAAEMKHVKWPTQNQALRYTGLVIAISVIVTVFVALADFVFTAGIDFIVNTF
jgi:preprotein translocase subunit SecE